MINTRKLLLILLSAFIILLLTYYYKKQDKAQKLSTEVNYDDAVEELYKEIKLSCLSCKESDLNDYKNFFNGIRSSGSFIGLKSSDKENDLFSSRQRDLVNEFLANFCDIRGIGLLEKAVLYEYAHRNSIYELRFDMVEVSLRIGNLNKDTFEFSPNLAADHFYNPNRVIINGDTTELGMNTNFKFTRTKKQLKDTVMGTVQLKHLGKWIDIPFWHEVEWLE